MIYLKHVDITPSPTPEWPFTIPALADIGRMEFPAPITLLCGENGSGKSTMLEGLAVKLSAPAVGRTDAGHDPTLAHLKYFARHMRTSFDKRPSISLFLRSEDFFNFIQSLHHTRQEMQQELKRVRSEYAGRDTFAQNQARMAYESILGDMQGRYGDDLLDQASHGESFLRLFESRLHPGGLYLMDEPEAPLSPLRQMALLHLIRRMADEDGCQFIIATHSPILLALPNAHIYNFDAEPAAACGYEDLESVRLIRDFLNAPQRYLRNL